MEKLRGWHGAFLLVALAAIIATLPEARALLVAGVIGGAILGVFLILIRQKSGPRPRRGSPIIVLFPRPVRQVTEMRFSAV